MDQKQIEEIVRSVMASMGQGPRAVRSKVRHHHLCAPVTSESCALDLGSGGSKSVDWC